VAKYYRVHPFVESAPDAGPGHAMYVPAVQTEGRIDNEPYSSFYVGESPPGAVAEAFGDHEIWTPDLFEGPPKLKGSRIAISTFDGDLDLVDMDDASRLVDLGVRPSRVVTRHRRYTQAWALAVYHSVQCQGVRWWSYHEPDIGSIGLWDWSGLVLEKSEPLHATHPAFVQAQVLLSRPLRDAS